MINLLIGVNVIVLIAISYFSYGVGYQDGREDRMKANDV
jgi:hypothetical protein